MDDSSYERPKACFDECEKAYQECRKIYAQIRELNGWGSRKPSVTELYEKQIAMTFLRDARILRLNRPNPRKLILNHTAPKPSVITAPRRYNGNVVTSLYYVKVNSEYPMPLYKIGITRTTIEKRFSTDKHLITYLKSWSHRSFLEARRREYYLHQRYQRFKYNGPPVLKGGGNTELFIKDILNLDKPSRNPNRK